jgi:hypothetical protein
MVADLARGITKGTAKARWELRTFAQARLPISRDTQTTRIHWHRIPRTERFEGLSSRGDPVHLSGLDVQLSLEDLRPEAQENAKQRIADATEETADEPS